MTSPTNWHVIPLDVVAAAAAAGDVDAQAALRIHESLDRIERSVLDQRPDNLRPDDLEAGLYEIRRAIIQAIDDHPLYSGM